MRKFLTICAILLSLSASAQWQQTGSKVRYVNGIGIPTKDTAAGVSADSSQILIRPADSSLYVKYKRTWQKVGSGGGGGISGSGTINRVPKWTSSTALGNSSIVDSASAVAMTINPSGNVGIGITSPTSKLDIRGPSGVGLQIYETSTGNDNRLIISQVGNEARFQNTFSTGAARFTWLAGSTEIMRIDTSSNVGIGYTAPAAKLSVNGTTLINTNTDNGVDKLQVSGSAIAEILKATGTGNNLAILNGTGTTNAYVDFQNAGTTQWRVGNDYNGGSRLFRINDVAGSVNTMLVNSSNQIGFNMPTTSFLGSNSAMELHKTTTQFINRFLSWSSTGLGVQNEARSTRSNTPGSYSATLSGDPIYAYVAYGSTNSAHAYAGLFGYYQNGSTGTYVPGYWTISASGGSTADRTKFNVDGGNDRIEFWTTSTERMRVTTSGRVLMGTTLPTDNTVDELQVNGSISGIGFKQAYVTKTGAYTATNDDYVIDCTSGTFTVTLPASSGRTGRILIIKNSGAGTITVDGNASETIDGATTYSLSVQYATVQIMSDGTNWKIIAKF
jgi:hypothetical protein